MEISALGLKVAGGGVGVALRVALGQQVGGDAVAVHAEDDLVARDVVELRVTLLRTRRILEAHGPVLRAAHPLGRRGLDRLSVDLQLRTQVDEVRRQ
jgi:hypothetical protein